MPSESPAAVLVDINGNELAVIDAAAIPVGTPGILVGAKDSSGNMRFLEAVLDGGVYRLQTDARIVGPLGQGVAAVSIPVVIASNQSAVPISAAALPLPAGAATEVTLSLIEGKDFATQTTLAAVLAQLDVALSTRASEATVANLATEAKLELVRILLASIDTSNSSLDTKLPSQGQAFMAASLPVAIAFDQSTLPISAAALPLPAGAATEVTLALLEAKDFSTEVTLAAVLAQLDVDLSTRASEATVATLATEAKLEAVRVLLASIDAKDFATETTLAAVLAQLDVDLSTRASEATVATLATEAKLETVRVLLASIDTKFPAQGQAAMAASVPVAIASDQSDLDVILKDGVNAVELAVVPGVAMPANTRALVFAGMDETGTAQFADIVVDSVDGTRGLRVIGKVSITAPEPPAGTTPVTLADDTPLAITSSSESAHVIADGTTFTLQLVEAGSEGDSTSKGSKVEVIYDDQVNPEKIIERIYVAGSTVSTFPNTGTARDGTALVGTVAGEEIIIRRTRLSGSSQEVDAVLRGFEQ